MLYVYTTHVYTHILYIYTYIHVILYIPMNTIKYVHPRIYIGGARQLRGRPELCRLAKLMCRGSELGKDIRENP